MSFFDDGIATDGGKPVVMQVPPRSLDFTVRPAVKAMRAFQPLEIAHPPLTGPLEFLLAERGAEVVR